MFASFNARLQIMWRNKVTHVTIRSACEMQYNTATHVPSIVICVYKSTIARIEQTRSIRIIKKYFFLFKKEK